MYGLDDGLVLVILSFLDPWDILALASAEPRITSDTDASGLSIAERCASSRIGTCSTQQALLAMQAQCQSRAKANFAVLRLLTARAATELLLRCSELEIQTGCSKTGSTASVTAFLDALFSWELTARRSWKGNDRLFRLVSRATEAAFATLLQQSFDSIVAGSAAAVRATEQELDRMVDEGCTLEFQRGYELIARTRSAVEFLRCHLSSREPVAKLGDEPERAELDHALEALDGTILGYIKEGYDFACPLLRGGVASSALPYGHWWFFQSRAASNGWVCLPGTRN